MGGMLRVFCDERYVERVLYDGRCIERERVLYDERYVERVSCDWRCIERVLCG